MPRRATGRKAVHDCGYFCCHPLWKNLILPLFLFMTLVYFGVGLVAGYSLGIADGIRL